MPVRTANSSPTTPLPRPLWKRAGSEGTDSLGAFAGGYCQDQRRGDAVPLGLRPEEGAERVLSLGAKLVMVTLGPKGCLLKKRTGGFPRLPEGTSHRHDRRGRYLRRQRRIPLSGTEQGAGGLTRDDLAYMARYAAAAASLSTEVSGAIPSIPKKGKLSCKKCRTSTRTDTHLLKVPRKGTPTGLRENTLPVRRGLPGGLCCLLGNLWAESTKSFR